MGGVDLDPASTATANEVVGATEYCSIEDSGLGPEPWHGRVWMNPHYSQPLIGDFCDRLIEDYLDGDVTEACVLVNNATETEWFQRLAANARAICFPRGRVKFWHPERESAPLQGQAVIYLGTEPEKFRDSFRSFGLVVTA